MRRCSIYALLITNLRIGFLLTQEALDARVFTVVGEDPLTDKSNFLGDWLIFCMDFIFQAKSNQRTRDCRFCLIRILGLST